MPDSKLPDDATLVTDACAQSRTQPMNTRQHRASSATGGRRDLRRGHTLDRPIVKDLAFAAIQPGPDHLELVTTDHTLLQTMSVDRQELDIAVVLATFRAALTTPRLIDETVTHDLAGIRLRTGQGTGWASQTPFHRILQ